MANYIFSIVLPLILFYQFAYADASPYVKSLALQGNQLIVNFSEPVQGAVDKDVTVDTSQCLAQGGAFDNAQVPAFISPAVNGGYNSIRMTFNPKINIPTVNSQKFLNITIQGVVSYPGNSPLLGNTKYVYVTSPAFVGSPDKFSLKSGIFTMSIPCSTNYGASSTVQCSCLGKKNGDPDGCGGTCCVPSCPAPIACSPKDMATKVPDGACGGVCVNACYGKPMTGSVMYQLGPTTCVAGTRANNSMAYPTFGFHGIIEVPCNYGAPVFQECPYPAIPENGVAQCSASDTCSNWILDCSK